MRLHWPLINIATLFFLPLIAASVLLMYRKDIMLPTMQHGSFVQPPQQIILSNIEYIAGHDYRQKWLVVYIQPASCDSKCQQQKKLLHKLHIALGADTERVAIISTLQKDINTLTIDNDLLILEPQSLCIMRYTGTVDHRGLLKDLRRLLKYSHA